MSAEKKMKPWTPIENLAESLYIRAIYDDYEGLRIILAEYDNETKEVLIEFRRVSAYRLTEELIGMHILDGYSIEPFENGECRPWSLFTLTNSEYLKWASDKSNTASEAFGLVHYLISTEDETLEVLSSTTPIVEFIDVPETNKKES